MKRLFLTIVILMLLVSMGLGCQAQESLPVDDKIVEKPEQLSMEQKLEDFEYMYKILEENYPFFEVNKRLNGVDWLANKEKYTSRVNMAMTEQQYKETLEWILSDLNNDHTNIIGKKYYRLLKKFFESDKEKWKPWCVQMDMENAVRRNSDANERKGSTSVSISEEEYITPDNVEAKLLLKKKGSLPGNKKLEYL